MKLLPAALNPSLPRLSPFYELDEGCLSMGPFLVAAAYDPADLVSPSNSYSSVTFRAARLYIKSLSEGW